jgi:hypothetical protein
MAFIHSPKIITDGLVLALDAGNTKSYRSGSTTWTDLSGNLNSGSLLNGVSFVGDNSGILNFDGTNDKIALPPNFFNHDAGTPFTVSLWFRRNQGNNTILFGQQNVQDSGAAGYVPAIYINSSSNVVASCFWSGTTSNVAISPQTIVTGRWYNVTVTFESTTHKSYLDGILYDTRLFTQANYTSIYYYNLGFGTYGGWPGYGDNNSEAYYNGNISNFMFYTKALSATEVLQNFNATRSRFGV